MMLPTEVSHAAPLLTLRICNVHEPLQRSEAPAALERFSHDRIFIKIQSLVDEIARFDHMACEWFGVLMLQEKRKSLHEVKVGDKLSGRVVEVTCPSK